MSGNARRVFLCMLLSTALVACGGGGGGGGGGGSNTQLDTDKDGVLDIQDVFPNDPKEWLDTDKDGVGDNSDVFPNDPKETKDTDKDGVGDNSDAFPNDPNETKDTDKDGVGDNADTYPNDATETVDTDKDGIGDNADTTPLGQVIPSWSTFQGSAKHLGWVDVTLNVADFKQRWDKSLQMATLQQGVAGDGYVFLNNGGVLYALDARTGETLWTRNLVRNGQEFYSYNPPAYSDGIVYVQIGGSNPILQAFNAADGAVVFAAPLSDSSGQPIAPAIVDGTIYVMASYYGSVYALDAKTGQQKWTKNLSIYDQPSLAVSDNYALTYTNSYSPRLIVINRLTGNTEFEITDPAYSWNGSSNNMTSVIAGDIVLGNYHGRAVGFNLTTKQMIWNYVGSFIGQPAVKGNLFYINNNGVIEIRALDSGSLLSSISGASAFIGSPVVTNNLVFIRDGQNTYAYSVESGALVWTLSGKSGDMLLAEGALVVFTANGVVAVDVEREIDADGLPDWWEKRFGKNINPAADTDGDGLTGLEEFTHSTHPLVADVDGDKLLDGEEIANSTSPYKADSDGDGLSDYLEVKTHLTDPTKVDSDNDNLRDGEEIAVGLDPLNASDALVDTDGDGFSNLHEIRANTALNDPASKPQMTEWSTQLGNPARNSYLPQLLNDTRFSERWTISSQIGMINPVTGAGKLFVRAGATELVALDGATGEESWRQYLTESATVASTQDDKLVYLESGDSNGNFNLVSLNSANGNRLYSKSLGSSYYNSAPIVYENKIYHVSSDNRSFKAYDLASGNLLWSSAMVNEYFSNNRQHLLSGQRLIGLRDQGLTIFSTTDGSLIKTLNLAVSAYVNKAALGTKSNVLLRINAGLMSVNTADGTIGWSRVDCSAEQFAVGNGKVYTLGQNKLCVINEQDGALEWSLDVTGEYWISNLVLTANHLFYSDGNKTYAIDLTQRALSWSMNKGASELVMGADGTLYLVSNYQVTAVDTEGDTDADGLPQWWERRYGADLVASADLDGDELTNLEEFAAKTNPLLADTDGDSLGDAVELRETNTNPLLADSDKDGLNDGTEVIARGSNPLLTDSDGDGISDDKEVAAGMEPADASDAESDYDHDGFTNREEISAGTDLVNAASKPRAGDWAMDQVNAAHNGFQPYRLDSDDFSLRWQNTFTQSLKGVATGDKRLFASASDEYSYDATLTALNVVDGKEQWKKNTGTSYFYRSDAPAYVSGKVLLSQYPSPAGMRAFDSRLGTELYTAAFSSGSSEQTPIVIGSTAYYTLGSVGIQAKDTSNGTTLWTKGITASENNITANNHYIFYTYGTNIVVLDRATGVQAFTINTYSGQRSNLILGSRNNILSFNAGLTSFDITTRKINWRIPVAYSNNLPAVGNGRVYYASGGKLSSLDEVNGAELWSWQSDDGNGLNSNIIVTLSHVFVASPTKTYALSATTGELEWTYNMGGSLALGTDGALYIKSQRQLVAISLEGDRDDDGLPDWWERHYGLDPEDAGDAALDLDVDGLTNLEEFTYGSYADSADSDGDGLVDMDEVNTHQTDPTSPDSDKDGMSDGWEADNSLDPLDSADRDLDSDSDQVPNFFEFLSGTDPHDAASLPVFFSPVTHSFEDGQLPIDWTLSADTIDVSVNLTTASHGTKSLQLRYKADISFSGFFAASDFSLDIKSNCGSSYQLSIYVDDKLMATGSAGATWSTLKTVIPLGNHKVSIRSDSYSCALLIDKVVVAAAASNVEMGVQFVSLYDNVLQFVDVDGKVTRTIAVAAPAKNLTARNLATLGNEKLAVLFNGNTRHLGLLDLQTLSWRYFDIQDQLVNDYSYGQSGFVARGNYAYVSTYTEGTNSYAITRFNLSSGAISRFGNQHYGLIALGSDDSIYAYSNGVIDKYDATTLTLVSRINVIQANQILLDSQDRLVVAAANTPEVVRYNAQKLIDARLELTNWVRAIAVNERNELITTNGDTVSWYSSDWQRSRTFTLRATHIVSVPQPDTDLDGMPDWWELAYGLDPLDAADATSDGDADGLNTLQEFVADTNPTLDDTDGDLLNDGDEVNDFKTNPNLADTDGDTLTDAEEVINHQTNPLLVDTDGDLVPDALELNQFGTDPKDATKKPAAYVNFLESFENNVLGWLRPVAGSNAGWSVVSGTASVGSRSLRSENLGYNETAQVEWAGLYNQSTLSFDMKGSSSYCCYVHVYVDNQLQTNFYVNEQWQTWNLSMSPGFHTVRFVYRKTTSAPNMYVWLDNVRVQ